MKAVIVNRYGPPEHAVVVDRPMPEPRPDEVLVRVEAAAVTAGDARLRSGTFPPGFTLPGRLGMGVRGPRVGVLGNSFAGVVEKVGADVDGLTLGDDVAGMTGFRMGAHAQYLRTDTTALARMPDGVTHVDAAAVLFGGTTAVHFLRDRAGLRAGESVLVNGASGSVGTSAVQVARHLGAHVTAVTSGRNADLVRRLGAETVIDHTTTAITTLDGPFDVVLDAVGTIAHADRLALLTETGRFAVIVGSLVDLARSRGRIIGGSAPENATTVADVLDLLAGGELDPVVEVVGGLDAVVDAYRVVDTGHKVGNLVVTPHRASPSEDTTR